MNFKTKKIIIIGLSILLISIIFCGGLFGGLFATYGQAMFTGRQIQQSKADKYAALSDKTPKNGVVFLGDSISELYDLDKYYPGKNYINRGISSNESGQVLDRLQTNVINISPDLIILLVGANDIGHGIANSVLINNIDMIITQLKNTLPNADIVIQSIYPTGKKNFIYSHMLTNIRPNETIREVNKEIYSLADKHDILYVDMYSVLADPNGNLFDEYSIDGVHLNKNGYAVVTNVLQPIIESYL